MYIADYFKNQNSREIAQVINDFSFASIVSKDLDDEIFISHIPILAKFEEERLVTLSGHFAQRNPHVEYLKAKPNATLIFHGPHSYISPKWYRSGRDVPTWNYVVVHVKGRVEFNSSSRDLIQLLSKLSQKNEGSDPSAWRFELPADLKDEKSLMAAIISFQLAPSSIESKFKLSQNRSIEDQDGILEGLAESDFKKFLRDFRNSKSL